VRVRTLKFVYEKKSPPQQLAVRIAASAVPFLAGYICRRLV
jgi:hypothetical protein